MVTKYIDNFNQPEIVHLLDIFGVFIVESSKKLQLVFASELPRYLAYVDNVFEGIVSPIMVKFDLVGLSFSFDALLGFVSYSNNVPTSSCMDLSIIFQNLFSYCDGILLVRSINPISQIMEIHLFQDILETCLEYATCHWRVDLGEDNMIDIFRWKSILKPN